MVTILPRYDPGGEIGKSIGAGIGAGAEDVTKRHLLRQGVQGIKDEMQTKRDSGETINPLDITLSLMDKVGTMPGGLQALSELAPAIHKEVLRQNLSQGQGTGPQSKQMPARSIIEGEEIVKEGRQDTELNPDEYYNAKYQENLSRTGDPQVAAEMTNAQLGAKTAEQNRRIQEQTAATNFLDQKLGETFEDGLSAPIKNEFAKQYFDAIKTTDPNRAFNQMLPKFRAAQRAEESLKTANASTRPILFTGDINQRMKAASTELKPIADIDPEYAMGLAMNSLDWGPSEAARIIKPGDGNFNQFVNQIKEAPQQDKFIRGTAALPNTKAFNKAYDKYINQTQPKLEKFLRKGWNPEKDSLLALRADLYDKGFPEEKFLESVDKVFPEKNQDPNLSSFNQNEYSKLGEPIIPGLQNIFSQVLSGRFGITVQKALEAKVRGKR